MIDRDLIQQLKDRSNEHSKVLKKIADRCNVLTRENAVLKERVAKLEALNKLRSQQPKSPFGPFNFGL